jgi:hypothetical protein
MLSVKAQTNRYKNYLNLGYNNHYRGYNEFNTIFKNKRRFKKDFWRA